MPSQNQPVRRPNSLSARSFPGAEHTQLAVNPMGQWRVDGLTGECVQRTGRSQSVASFRSALFCQSGLTTAHRTPSGCMGEDRHRRTRNGVCQIRRLWQGGVPPAVIANEQPNISCSIPHRGPDRFACRSIADLASSVVPGCGFDMFSDDMSCSWLVSPAFAFHLLVVTCTSSAICFSRMAASSSTAWRRERCETRTSTTKRLPRSLPAPTSRRVSPARASSMLDRSPALARDRPGWKRSPRSSTSEVDGSRRAGLSPGVSGGRPSSLARNLAVDPREVWGLLALVGVSKGTVSPRRAFQPSAE